MDHQTPPPPLSDTTTTVTDDTNSSTEDNNTTTLPPPTSTKLRLMCSYNGHIVPRPHDKSLCYLGGDTRIVVVDRHTTLSDLHKTLLRSTATSPFTLKYQLPSEDLDSLISVTTDEDLENMIDEYERLNSDVTKSSRLRLFLFPTKPESVTSFGSLLENSTKSDDWFLNALNGNSSGFSDTSSVNCLLGLDDDVSVPEKKDIKNTKVNNNSGQDVQSVPDLERLDRTSSFGSASSSLASLPPIRVHVESQQQKVDDVAYVSVPVVVSTVTSDSVSSDGRQQQGIVYQDQLVKMQSNNSNNVTDQSPRIQMQVQQQVSDSGYVMSMSNAQVQQQQFMHTAVQQPQYVHHHPSGAVPMTSYYQIYPSQNQNHVHHQALDQQNFVYYMPARQAPHGYSLQMQQHAAGYAEVSSGGGTPLAHSQAPGSAYATTRGAQSGSKSEMPAQFVQVPSSQHQPQPQYVGYSQMHHQPQSVASGGGGNYGYEFADPAQGQPMYYAAQPLPPQSNAQYQTVSAELGTYVATDNGTNQQQGRSQQQP